MKILAVDDDQDARKFLSDLLVQAGHRVTTAADAGEASAALRRTPFDVVLLDLMMPGTDGFELAREISGSWETSRIPLVAVTCLRGKESKALAKAFGCTRYIEKPFDVGQLFETLRDIDRGDGEAAWIGA